MHSRCEASTRKDARRRSPRVASLALLLAVAACAGEGREGSGGGLVSAASPEAADAGAEILALGGNAIDAAIAVQFALGVTEPAMSGLGGQTQILFQRPGEAARVINGTSYSPVATPGGAGADDLVGHRATTVPATVNTLAFAHRRFGSGRVSWERLLEPAIRYAEDGFEVGTFRAKVWARHAADLAADPVTARLFLVDGEPPAEGATFRQPVLAGTLRRIAAGGAEAFYRGGIAEAIGRDMEVNGGWVSTGDLAGLGEPAVIPAITTTYRGYDVASLPPPGGGWVVLQLLNLLELSEPEALSPSSATRVLHVIDALRLVHAERRDNPVYDLVDYGNAIAERVNKSRARDAWEGRAAVPVGAASPAPDPCAACSWGETTHFSVVDGDGMAVAATASINAFFGARAASPELGFLYNDYMREFVLSDPSHPFALRGGAMPYSSMSPTIVGEGGVPALVAGSPGSARIPSAVAQVIQLWIDEGLPVDEAVAAPRLHVVPDDEAYVERTAADVADALARAGYRVVAPEADLALGGLNAYFGGVHALARGPAGWNGAADPRRDGAVRRAAVGEPPRH